MELEGVLLMLGSRLGGGAGEDFRPRVLTSAGDRSSIIITRSPGHPVTRSPGHPVTRSPQPRSHGGAVSIG